MKSHTDKITYTENAVGKATTGGSPDTSDNSLNDASYASKFMPVPPDGGYGWVIVVVCFLGFGLLEGITGTFGVLFPHILRRFEAGRAKTALAGSVFCGTYLITGQFRMTPIWADYRTKLSNPCVWGGGCMKHSHGDCRDFVHPFYKDD